MLGSVTMAKFSKFCGFLESFIWFGFVFVVLLLFRLV
jgi:hypothetical protein